MLAQFHIVFEIFLPNSPSLGSLPAAIQKLVNSSATSFFPTRDTDIFDPNLPRTQEFLVRCKNSKASSSKSRADRRAWSYDLDYEILRGAEADFPTQAAQRRLEDVVTAKNIYQNIRSPGAHQDRNGRETPQVSEGDSQKHLDYRFSFISVESIDMGGREDDPTSKAGRVRAKSFMLGNNNARPASATTKAEFIPLKSKVTGFGYGIVHLYREVDDTTSTTNSRAPPEKSSVPADEVIVGEGNAVDLTPESDPEDLTTVAILAVPSYMTPSDFLGFVGDEARDNVSHFRMIRTGDNARRYMVLMKFREKEQAQEFVQNFNGRVFNSMEPETCHVVFVRSIKFQAPNQPNHDSGDRLHPSAYPDITNDPFSPTPSPQPPEGSVNLGDGDHPLPYQLPTSPTLGKSFSSKPAPPPTPSLLELPTCPVCLERMDETTGLLTIQCQHVFHCACLSKWKDSSCPVCRYSSVSSIGSGRRRTGGRQPHGGENNDDDTNMCNICGALANLWICLICGNVGCGRYDEKHAYEHFLDTSHCFAMDVDSQRVWDYASDAYVHRLIQNKSDGKLVELPANANTTTLTGTTNGEYVPIEKLENICMEYTHLLTSQLDSQRIYYEEQLLAAADKTSMALSKADIASDTAEDATAQLGSIQSKFDELQSDVLPTLEKSKERAEKKAEKAVEMLRKLDKDFRDEKAVSNGLMQRVEVLSKENNNLKQQNEELKEQIRDLMFFVEGREKLKDIDEEGIEEGVVTVGETGGDISKRRRKGKGKGKAQK